MFENLSECDYMPASFGPLKEEDIERIDYFLSPPTEVEGEVRVKLGARCILTTGESFGNIIQIPFEVLLNLISNYSKE